jgi:hypothetical protein
MRSSMALAGVSSLLLHLGAIVLVTAWPHSRIVPAPLDDEAVLLSVVGAPDPAPPRPALARPAQDDGDVPPVVRKARRPPVAMTALARRPGRPAEIAERPLVSAPLSVDLAATAAVVNAPAAVTAPASSPAAQPVRLAPEAARALRVYDVFPSAPASVRTLGGSETLLVEICVSQAGAVSGVRFELGGGGALANSVGAAIATWRYQPLLVGGAPQPFCHEVKIEYRSHRG